MTGLITPTKGWSEITLGDKPQELLRDIITTIPSEGMVTTDLRFSAEGMSEHLFPAMGNLDTYLAECTRRGIRPFSCTYFPTARESTFSPGRVTPAQRETVSDLYLRGGRSSEIDVSTSQSGMFDEFRQGLLKRIFEGGYTFERGKFGFEFDYGRLLVNYGYDEESDDYPIQKGVLLFLNTYSRDLDPRSFKLATWFDALKEKHQ